MNGLSTGELGAQVSAILTPGAQTDGRTAIREAWPLISHIATQVTQREAPITRAQGTTTASEELRSTYEELVSEQKKKESFYGQSMQRLKSPRTKTAMTPPPPIPPATLSPNGQEPALMNVEASTFSQGGSTDVSSVYSTGGGALSCEAQRQPPPPQPPNLSPTHTS